MSKKKTHEEYIAEVFELVGNEYEVLDKYVKNNEPLLMKHNNADCNYHTYKVSPSNFKTGRRCPECKKLNSKKRNLYDTTIFKEKIKILVGNEYEVLGNYTDSKSNIKMFHATCNRPFEMKPANFLYGQRCPNCKSSKGERELLQFLSGLACETQKRINDCRNIKPLPFDFHVENKVLIEFDGRQHFESIEGRGGEIAFRRTYENDNIKNEYCIKNNIPLIRIPYREIENKEHILENIFAYLNIGNTNNTYDAKIVSKYLVNLDWNHDKYIEEYRAN